MPYTQPYNPSTQPSRGHLGYFSLRPTCETRKIMDTPTTSRILAARYDVAFNRNALSIGYSSLSLHQPPSFSTISTIPPPPPQSISSDGSEVILPWRKHALIIMTEIDTYICFTASVWVCLDLCVCIYVHMSACLCIYLSLCLTVWLCRCMFVSMSVCLPQTKCMSARLCLSACLHPCHQYRHRTPNLQNYRKF